MSLGRNDGKKFKPKRIAAPPCADQSAVVRCRLPARGSRYRGVGAGR
jgi:hypothetical protein